MAHLEWEITVAVHCGVHGRVAADLARIARENRAQIMLDANGTAVDCSSILEVLSLGITRGSQIRVRISSTAPEQVFAQIHALLTEEGH